ncbi:hypothetical protein P170DRAFT_172662 [Aspergillus steynii IBT 23096]|uniref:Uncharacterized protein n=1 Tax=Aspergillus steynii IBT 23096 TaxID=1392250 RepID=A0A2I2G806_9EURO|nr:uncharacterized protein P170DRAFT_172662 [Aspergillus steynii IBT 23096]PLB49019.1 hypothetical protein P170DRAFT_172662 [Aspergillus steynii IBT 23096]
MYSRLVGWLTSLGLKNNPQLYPHVSSPILLGLPFLFSSCLGEDSLSDGFDAGYLARQLDGVSGDCLPFGAETSATFSIPTFIRTARAWPAFHEQLDASHVRIPVHYIPPLLFSNLRCSFPWTGQTCHHFCSFTVASSAFSPIDNMTGSFICFRSGKFLRSPISFLLGHGRHCLAGCIYSIDCPMRASGCTISKRVGYTPAHFLYVQVYSVCLLLIYPLTEKLMYKLSISSAFPAVTLLIIHINSEW